MKVYVLTEGEYSDYRVNAVFSSQTAANAAKDAGAGESIEEFELYDAVPPQTILYIHERLNGRESRRAEIRWPWDIWQDPAPSERPRFYEWDHGRRVYGTDEAAVEKAWQDREAEERAKAEGLA